MRMINFSKQKKTNIYFQNALKHIKKLRHKNDTPPGVEKYGILVSWLPAKFKIGSHFRLGRRFCQPLFESKQPISGWANY